MEHLHGGSWFVSDLARRATSNPHIDGRKMPDSYQNFFSFILFSTGLICLVIEDIFFGQGPGLEP